LPGKELKDGLVPVETDADCASMVTVSNSYKCIVLFVDHTDFLRHFREDIIINGGSKMPAPSRSTIVVSQERHSDQRQPEKSHSEQRHSETTRGRG
jgi:hypothetical protein